jgi:hypothetical protein
MSAVDRSARASVPAARFVTENPAVAKNTTVSATARPPPQGGQPIAILPVEPNGCRYQAGNDFSGDAEVRSTRRTALQTASL